MFLLLRLVDDVAAFLFHKHLLRVHLVLREVFHVSFAEASHAAVERDVGKVDALDFHAFHEFA